MGGERREGSGERGAGGGKRGAGRGGGGARGMSKRQALRNDY